MLSLNVMCSLLFTVIMLTVLFGATAGLAFVFRRSALKGREGGMYYIWLAVIMLAVIPIRIGEPVIILFPSENQQSQSDNTVNSNNTLKLSERLNYNSSIADFAIIDEIQESDENANKKNYAADRAGETGIKDAKPKYSTVILKLIGENKDAIISGLLIIWFAGFMFVTVRIICSYFKMKKLFYEESDICVDERISGIFEECLKIVGLNRRVNLRIMKWDFSSPCVCGLLNPTVFIDDTCVSMNDGGNAAKKLKYIFIHELYHIKRYDMLYKVLSIIVAGVHWFNPLTHRVVRTIGEDCELSVDRQVMNIFRKESQIPFDEQSNYYMNIILDIAEQKCAGKNRQAVNIPSASLFFGETRNIDFLKRRYANMKNITTKKRLIITLSIILTAIISINIIIMSSCGIFSPANAYTAPTEVTINKYSDQNIYEAALRLYFGLLPGEEITQEQLEEITEISIIRGVTTKGAMTDNINNISLGNLTPVSFIINGMEFNMVPSIVHKRVYEEYIEAKLIEKFGENSRDLNKLNAYYSIKDLNDPNIEPRAREELLVTYPIAEQYPIAVFDPNTSTREYSYILGMFATAGLLDDSFIESGTMEAGYLTRLPNLQKVTFVNIRAQKLELLPDTVSISTETIPHFDISDPAEPLWVWSDGTPAEQPASETSSDQSQEPSGVFEAPNYGMNIADDGTEYVEFNNQSLHAALCEYFAISKWDYITPDMLNQITSINVTMKPEYDYIYSDEGLRNQFNLNCQYIEYTINGETLDILPKIFAADGLIESLLERESIDILQYFAKTSEIMGYGEGTYELCRYVPKENLSDEDKLFLYGALARQGMMRISVYIDNDGKYFTVSDNPVMFTLGFTARYHDKPEYDAADIAYMPNLKEFKLDGITEKK